MPVDDDIAVEDHETAEAPSPARRSNRGFWLVAGALLVGCVFMLVEIFANFGMKDTIAHAEHTLRTAQAAADRVHATDGTYGARTTPGSPWSSPPCCGWPGPRPAADSIR